MAAHSPIVSGMCTPSSRSCQASCSGVGRARVDGVAGGGLGTQLTEPSFRVAGEFSAFRWQMPAPVALGLARSAAWQAGFAQHNAQHCSLLLTLAESISPPH